MKAKYSEEEQKQIVIEYEVFKDRLKDMMRSDGKNKEIVTRFQHLLFKTQTCHAGCRKVFIKEKGKMVCPENDQILQPLKPELMKIIHIFYKEPSLYSGIQNFLYLFLRKYYFNYNYDI